VEALKAQAHCLKQIVQPLGQRIQMLEGESKAG
jgi:hypothetical protein